MVATYWSHTKRKPKEVGREPIRHHILNILSGHLGKENRILMVDLCNKLIDILNLDVTMKYFERLVRDEIEWLRENDDLGCWICSTMDDHGGRYIARDRDELDEFLNSDRSRFITGLARVEAQARKAGLQSPAQMSMLLKPAEDKIKDADANAQPVYF